MNAVYAVIDTNVLVSALFSKKSTSPPVRVVEAALLGKITPLFNNEIIEEYRDVLGRDKFKFNQVLVNQLISALLMQGLNTDRNHASSISENFPDPDDVVFFEVAMNVDDSYLVTGNQKHFPKKPFIVTPGEMVDMLIKKGLI